MSEDELDKEIIRQKVLELRMLCVEKGAKCVTLVLIGQFLVKDIEVEDKDFIAMMGNLMVNEPKFKRLLNESVKSYENFLDNYEN